MIHDDAQAFEVIQLFTLEGKAFVTARVLSNTNFVVTTESTLGGVSIEPSLDIPRLLDSKGRSRTDRYVFALCDARDVSRFGEGQIVLLEQQMRPEPDPNDLVEWDIEVDDDQDVELDLWTEDDPPARDWALLYAHLIGRHGHTTHEKLGYLSWIVGLTSALVLTILVAPAADANGTQTIVVAVSIYVLMMYYIVHLFSVTVIFFTDGISKSSVFPWHAWYLPRYEIRHLEALPSRQSYILIFRLYSGAIREVYANQSLRQSVHRALADDSA